MAIYDNHKAGGAVDAVFLTHSRQSVPMKSWVSSKKLSSLPFLNSTGTHIQFHRTLARWISRSSYIVAGDCPDSSSVRAKTALAASVVGQSITSGLLLST